MSGKPGQAQIEFPHGDRALKLDAAQSKLRVPGIGTMRLRRGRVIPAFGRAWIIEKNGRWHACFECDREVRAKPETGRVIGIDRGVHVLAATSEGTLYRNPKIAESGID